MGGLEIAEEDALTTVLVASVHALEKRRELVEKFVKAHVELTAWVNEKGQPEFYPDIYGRDAQLHARLSAAGLFDTARKKPIPIYPSRITIVTSRQTAALQDVLKVLQRFSWLEIGVYHTPVQGEGAGQKIADAIAHLKAHDIAVERGPMQRFGAKGQGVLIDK